MEKTLQKVAEHCGKQLESFQKCVEKNKQDWDTKCMVEKSELNKCSQENAPILKKVKQECSDIIQSYDHCISKNATQPDECIEQLQALYYCTKKVANEELPLGP